VEVSDAVRSSAEPTPEDPVVDDLEESDVLDDPLPPVGAPLPDGNVTVALNSDQAETIWVGIGAIERSLLEHSLNHLSPSFVPPRL